MEIINFGTEMHHKTMVSKKKVRYFSEHQKMPQKKIYMQKLTGSTKNKSLSRVEHSNRKEGGGRPIVEYTHLCCKVID